MVVNIHARQIERFGGTPGLRDEGLLESALAQPQATFGGQLLHPTIAEQAAAYLYHIAMNHPFIDGNKRSAFAVTDTFLRLNGCTLNLTSEFQRWYTPRDLSVESIQNLKSKILKPPNLSVGSIQNLKSKIE
ncbi:MULTISPECIES: type II toxin-antitoxin system death-on-curing family toxin [unclassified Microcoleus]|uniref:type II toxin-antitoxin system death-on-curing family toxin n=1 Tax=unclassified Microcoleus TaxID=2642155 RepID=UPI002FD2D5F2